METFTVTNNKSGMSDSILKQHAPRTRLISCLEHYGRPTLLGILHNPAYSSLPRDTKRLYTKLNNDIHLKKLKALKKKSVLKQKQWQLIFPSDVQETDSTNFDIPLCKILIEVCTRIPPPKNGWNRAPGREDRSDAAYVLRLVSLRNDLYHPTSLCLTNAKFNSYWQKLTKYLHRLGYNDDIQHLKASPLDCLGIDYIKAQQDVLELRVDGLETKGGDQILIPCWLQRLIAISLIFFVVAYYFPKCKHNLLSESNGLQEASSLLKQYYLESIGKEEVDMIADIRISKKRFYVQLAAVDSFDIDMRNTHSAREFHIKQMLDQSGTLTMEDMLEGDTHMTLLRGIGGIGKTFMVKTMALQWSENRLWKSIKFVFLFNFRELNLLNNVSSFSELLKMKYKFVFTKIELNDLIICAKNVVFIFDGLDEFVRINDLYTISENQQKIVSNISKSVFDALNPRSGSFPGHKTIITSRPNACPILKKSFKVASFNKVDIIGFSSEQVQEYIDVFSGKDHHLRNTLRAKIKESTQLKLMSKIPVYLWTICSLYQEQNFYQVPQTTTELFVWQLALFLHRHYKNNFNNDVIFNVFDVFKRKEVRKLVMSLAVLARTMLMKGVIMINEDELPVVVTEENLEATGLVSKLTTIDGIKYQFNHLLMQEFLTSLYYFFPPGRNETDFLTNVKLSGCLPLICGLQGALRNHSNSPLIVKQFVRNMMIQRNKVNPLNRMLSQRNEQLLQGIYEYQNSLSDNIINRCKTKPGCSRLTLTAKPSHVQSELVYFLEQYGERFVIESIEFEENQGAVSTVSDIKKIIQYICNLSRLTYHSKSFNEETLKYLITALNNCSRDWIGSSKWNYIEVKLHKNFVRDFGNTTNTLIDALLRYNEVKINIYRYSRIVIYNFRKSIMSILKSGNTIRLDSLTLDMGHMKPYFCEMLAEAFLCIRKVTVKKSFSSTDDGVDVDCLKDAIEDVLNAYKSKSFDWKLINSNYFKLEELQLDNWVLRNNKLSWSWEQTTIYGRPPVDGYDFTGDCCITFVIFIQAFPIFLMIILFSRMDKAKTDLPVDQTCCLLSFLFAIIFFMKPFVMLYVMVAFGDGGVYRIYLGLAQYLAANPVKSIIFPKAG